MTNFAHFSYKRLIRNTLCVIIGLFFFLGIYFFVRPICSVGRSMLPTIQNVHFLVTTPRSHNPFVKLQRGDVVIVRCEQRDALLTKRLIGLPEDTVEIRNNQIYINGTLLHESYLYESMVTKDVAPFTLGEDMYYVLGDNRNVSADSRYYGLFSGSDIYATVDLNNQPIYWLVLAVLFVNMLLWIAYLPDWDSPRTAKV